MVRDDDGGARCLRGVLLGGASRAPRGPAPAKGAICAISPERHVTPIPCRNDHRVAFLVFVLGALTGVGLVEVMGGGQSASLTGIGIGCLVFGAGGFFLGRWLNETRPDAKLEAHPGEMRQRLYAMVAQGTFQAAPGVPAPSTSQEAQMQVEQLVAAERAAVGSRLRNHSTLFWIPVQWWGIIEVLVGAACLVMGLVGSLG